MDDQSFQATRDRMFRDPKFILPLIIAVSLVAAVVFFCVPRSIADPDLWWHLRDAQIQLSTHTFLTHDLFSFTASGAHWMNHEWLAELPFYAAWKVSGPSGVYLVTLVTIEVIFLGLFFLNYWQSASIPASSVAAVIGILISTVSFGPRTLLFGWVLLVAELLVLAGSRRRERLIWVLPFLFAIWVNTHGSWLIGMVVFALFIAANSFTVSRGCVESTALSTKQLKGLVLCWLASAAALFLNPYGWRLVFYPFDLAFRQKLNIANVEEWKSLDFHTPRGRILFVCLALLCMLQLVRGRKWSLFELGLVAMGLYSGFTYSRFLFLAAILVMPSLGRSLASRSTGLRRGLSPIVGAALIFVIASCVVGRLRTPDPTPSDSGAGFPNTALPYLAAFHPAGNVFNEFRWGGFLEWNEPQIPVFIDSRVDIFEYNGTFKDYLDIIHLKDSMTLLDQHRIQYVLFGRDTPLIYLLKTSREWKVDYEDQTTTLLERTGPWKAK